MKSSKSPSAKNLSKREIKKSINPPSRFNLYFSIGLIVSMLACFFILQVEVKYGATNVADNEIPELVEPTIFKYIVEKPIEPKKPEAPKEKKVDPTPRKQVVTVNTNIIDAVPDTSKEPETSIAATDAPLEPTPKVPASTPAETTSPMNLLGVEHVPVYPGCEGLSTRQEQIDCMSSKISEFIGKKFNADKFDNLESGKTVSINCSFTIDEEGNITNIQSKSIEKGLETEANRVIGKLPKMQPGMQGNTKVPVTFGIPIRFKTN